MDSFKQLDPSVHFLHQAVPSLNGIVASLILFSPQNCLSDFDDPCHLQLYQNQLIKLVKGSRYATLLGLENTTFEDETFPSFIPVLKNLKEIFMVSLGRLSTKKSLTSILSHANMRISTYKVI
jgi:hypothetical protein